MLHIKYWCLFKFFSVVFAAVAYFSPVPQSTGSTDHTDKKRVCCFIFNSVWEGLIFSPPLFFFFLILFVLPHYVQMNIFRLISVYSPDCLSDSHKPVSSDNNKNESKENSVFKHRVGTSHLLFYKLHFWRASQQVMEFELMTTSGAGRLTGLRQRLAALPLSLGRFCREYF